MLEKKRMKLAFVMNMLASLHSFVASTDQVDVLIDLKLTLKASDNQLSGWSQNQVSPCAWMYINCDGDDVVQISFPSIGFTGTLSPRIGELSYLKGLFTGNRLNCGTNLHPCVSIVSDQKGSNHVKVEVVRGSIGVIVLLLAGVLYLKWKSRMKSRRNEVFVDVAGQNEPKIAFGQLKIFGWHELQIATDSFNERNVLGKGGFGKVYKGMLADNTKIAVKRLTNHGTPGGEAAFLHEVELISVAVHRNLLRLIGYCTTASERLLVYPFMHNLSVAYRLREFKPNEPELDWPTRKRVALGTAQGLEYLHEHCNPKIIHRDIKAANVLLDENFDPVVGDFGLAKLVDMTKTSVTTRVCGTMGHIAPEYLSTGKPSEKSDVFSYGIMLLELVTGQRAVDFSLSEGENEVLHIENEVLPTILAGTI
ncbi:LRR receptor kinase SERK2-like isoform X7 [Phoenix dactylifera]|uniref:non-specific serine/threonine protein kinase n=1 Tax=Phoenix dactylifera TaxID=42345 RepID=A0A8B9ALC7_PHODC|nr:LRR receptor kinase SERK2-like isoform X7 [Phoenix dactylifera]